MYLSTKPFIMYTTDMEPSINQYDVVHIEKSDKYVIGDIVLFSIGNTDIISRIISITCSAVVCKCDNTFELYELKTHEISGKISHLNIKPFANPLIHCEDFCTMSMELGKLFIKNGFNEEKTKKTSAYRSFYNKYQSRRFKVKDLVSKISNFNYQSAKELFEDMNKTDYVILKGEPLSVYAYGDTGKRTGSDIDILVSKDNIKHCSDILTANGFQSTAKSRFEKIFFLSHSHQASTWGKVYKTMNYEINIDINFDIFWGEYEGCKTDINEFISDYSYIDIWGVKVKTLPPIKMLIHLILHNYKDLNSIYLLSHRKSLTVKPFKDIFFLLKNNLPLISKDDLLKMCNKYNITPYAYYMLYYTNIIFQDEIISEYIDSLKNEEGIQLLSKFGLCKKEQKEWSCDFYSRLAAEDINCYLYPLLTNADMKKIAINKEVFNM